MTPTETANRPPAYNLTIVGGDGIGPEVCQAALDVVKAAVGSARTLTCSDFEAGADCYTRTGIAFPKETLEACRSAHAILHGAAGLPGVLYADGTEAGQDFTLQLRNELDLYANVRPIKLYAGVTSALRRFEPGSIDYVIVRENTEGLYASRGGGVVLGDEVATDLMVITRKGVERIVRYAAELARTRNGAPSDGVKRVTIVDKSNVLRSFAFFRKVADEVMADYPDIETDYALTDAMSVYMIERPDTFDVVVSENFVGDLLSDLGAATVGGMGMSAAAELGDGHGYFQASHGTAPDIAGKGIANPVATILSGACMLEWLGHRHDDDYLITCAENIRRATSAALISGAARTRDVGGEARTADCVEAICKALA
ncbi:MAG: isocitrate/isopropylmalate dehydrogenase family protein [Rhodospirillales bacterium]|nr:isocitrate/isopropylmalate dehydrogenase family protein [Rhodospirillales bacterium]